MLLLPIAILVGIGYLILHNINMLRYAMLWSKNACLYVTKDADVEL